MVGDHGEVTVMLAVGDLIDADAVEPIEPGRGC